MAASTTCCYLIAAVNAIVNCNGQDYLDRYITSNLVTCNFNYCMSVRVNIVGGGVNEPVDYLHSGFGGGILKQGVPGDTVHVGVYNNVIMKLLNKVIFFSFSCFDLIHCLIHFCCIRNCLFHSHFVVNVPIFRSCALMTPTGLLCLIDIVVLVMFI